MKPAGILQEFLPVSENGLTYSPEHLELEIESSIEVTGEFTEVMVDDIDNTDELAGEAEGIPYIVRSWNPETKQVETSTEVCTDYSVITGNTRELSGWYISSSYLELSDRLVVSGTANIILCNSSNLYCKDGICVSAGNTLNMDFKVGLNR